MGSVNLELDGPSCNLPVQGVTFYDLPGVIGDQGGEGNLGYGTCFRNRLLDTEIAVSTAVGEVGNPRTLSSELSWYV